VRDRGHNVIVFSEPGPLVAQVIAMGLEQIALKFRPLVGNARTMGAAVFPNYALSPTASLLSSKRLWPILMNVRMVAIRCGDAFAPSGAASPKLLS